MPNSIARQMEREGRLLHRDWELYDTAHAVFQPRRMTPRELEAGYTWAYQRLFSLRSIWQRRPAGWGSAAGYLAMSLIYKKMNLLWPLLIRWRVIHAIWRPLIEGARWRHMR